MADALTQFGQDTGNPFLGTNNPYLQANIDAASADMVRNFNTSATPSFNAAMLKSGSFGNSAIDEMQRNSASDLQKNLGNLSNSARMQDYQNQQGLYQWQKGFDETNKQWNLGFDKSVYDTTFGQNQQQLQTGIGLLGTLAGYNSNDLTNATNQQNTPLNYWQQFANQANSFGGMGGASNSTQGTSSNPLLGVMGGAQLGQAAWNAWNQPSSGGGITGTNGGNAGAWSTGATLNNDFGGGSSYYGGGTGSMGSAMGGFGG